MDFRLYQAMQNELNLRANNETGKLFSNQTTEQLKQLVSNYEMEIFLYSMCKTINHINKMERRAI
jgi:hypothetical protein